MAAWQGWLSQKKGAGQGWPNRARCAGGAPSGALRSCLVRARQVGGGQLRELVSRQTPAASPSYHPHHSPGASTAACRSKPGVFSHSVYPGAELTLALETEMDRLVFHQGSCQQKRNLFKKDLGIAVNDPTVSTSRWGH